MAVGSVAPLSAVVPVDPVPVPSSVSAVIPIPPQAVAAATSAKTSPPRNRRRQGDDGDRTRTDTVDSGRRSEEAKTTTPRRED
jgi:hypothetical protein